MLFNAGGRWYIAVRGKSCTGELTGAVPRLSTRGTSIPPSSGHRDRPWRLVAALKLLHDLPRRVPAHVFEWNAKRG
jgi:hypothetical protein